MAGRVWTSVCSGGEPEKASTMLVCTDTHILIIGARPSSHPRSLRVDRGFYTLCDLKRQVHIFINIVAKTSECLEMIIDLQNPGMTYDNALVKHFNWDRVVRQILTFLKGKMS